MGMPRPIDILFDSGSINIVKRGFHQQQKVEIYEMLEVNSIPPTGMSHALHHLVERSFIIQIVWQIACLLLVQVARCPEEENQVWCEHGRKFTFFS